MHTIVDAARDLFARLDDLDDETKLDTINELRRMLHAHSPLKHHPVDCVLWLKQSEIVANSYNPNVVAPPEMQLLERSITEDGYTQPIVAWEEQPGAYEIVDGYHRNLIGRKPKMAQKLLGRLPITIANADRTSKPDRMASTIRHDRACGTSSIELLQGIVADLVEAGMSDAWIMQHIGMDVDELLRLKQLTGLAALFRDAEFSRAWVAESDMIEEDRDGDL